MIQQRRRTDRSTGHLYLFRLLDPVRTSTECDAVEAVDRPMAGTALGEVTSTASAAVGRPPMLDRRPALCGRAERYQLNSPSRVNEVIPRDYAPCLGGTGCATFAPMNLKKTVAGTAIALGGATMMLGLGGTANASVHSNAAVPHVGHQVNDVVDTDDLSHVDPDNPVGETNAIHLDGAKDLVRSSATASRVVRFDAKADDSLLGVADNNGPSRVVTDVNLNH
jgi:hypothetical protein